jgi:ankyrin repeat protein
MSTSPKESFEVSTERFCQAAKGGNLDAIQWFYNRHGSDIVNAKDCCGRSALHYACANGKLVLVEYLVQTAGANIRTDTLVWRNTTARC